MKRSGDPSALEAKQNKLIARLQEQQTMVTCHLENETYVAYKTVWAIDPETNEKRKVRQQKKLRPWYYQINDVYYFEIKYGNKSLELQKGKPAIEVGKVDNLISTIDTIIEAVKNDELDNQLKQVTGPRKAKM